MKANFLVSASIATMMMFGAATAHAQTLTEVWRTDGFHGSESLSYDPQTNAIYLGNMNNAEGAEGGGYISKLDLDGKVVAQKFVSGLPAIFGNAIKDGKIYTVGGGKLIIIDIAKAEVAETIDVGEGLLNGIDVADDGTVYISDTMGSRVFAVKDGAVSVFVEGPELAGVNGVAVDGGRLVLATMGDMSKGFGNLSPSNIKQVDIASKVISDFGSAEGFGNLDGIVMINGGALTTDTVNGELYFVKEDGTRVDFGNTGTSSADHDYIAEKNLVVIPRLQANEVVAYEISF